MPPAWPAPFSKLYILAAPTFSASAQASVRWAQAGDVAEFDKNLTTQDPAAIRKHLPEYLCSPQTRPGPTQHQSRTSPAPWAPPAYRDGAR